MGTKAISGANGNHGRVRIYNSGSGPVFDIELCVTEWDLTEFATEEATVNSCSGGKREFEYGATHIEVTLTLDLDLSQHPLDSPPGFIVGTIPAQYIYLYEHHSGAFVSVSESWQLHNAKVLSCKVTVPAAGKVIYELVIKCSDYVRPYQSIASGV